jgi:hypothetical protein
VKQPGLTKITLNGKPQKKNEFDLSSGKWNITANHAKEQN